MCVSTCVEFLSTVSQRAWSVSTVCLNVNGDCEYCVSQRAGVKESHS
jgi:hypothetical protein